MKIKSSLGLIKYHAKKTFSGGGSIAPPFLTPALDGGECSAPRPCGLTPGETAPGTR
jgi:hypothetical protein